MRTVTITTADAVALAERHAARGDHAKARAVYLAIAAGIAKTGDTANAADRTRFLAALTLATGR
jgi:hypothetical protein